MIKGGLKIIMMLGIGLVTFTSFAQDAISSDIEQAEVYLAHDFELVISECSEKDQMAIIPKRKQDGTEIKLDMTNKVLSISSVEDYKIYDFTMNGDDMLLVDYNGSETEGYSLNLKGSLPVMKIKLHATSCAYFIVHFKQFKE